MSRRPTRILRSFSDIFVHLCPLTNGAPDGLANHRATGAAHRHSVSAIVTACRRVWRRAHSHHHRSPRPVCSDERLQHALHVGQATSVAGQHFGCSSSLDTVELEVLDEVWSAGVSCLQWPWAPAAATNATVPQDATDSGRCAAERPSTKTRCLWEKASPFRVACSSHWSIDATDNAR
jgi:hypothetical protein